MKPFHTFIGLLIFGLLAQHGLGDISLTLRNRARSNRRRQAYLPPPVQDVAVNNGRNNEEYYNVHEEHPQKFEESNYGNSRYQIFEVHNHYEPQQPQQQSHSPTQSNFEAKGYLPPHQEIRIQHVNQAQDTNDDHLDVSFLSYAAGEGTDGQQITIAEHAPSAAPPTPTVPVPFPSNYQHDFQKSSGGAKELEEAIFQAAGYLPPSEGQAHGTPKILVKHIDGQTGQEIRQPNYRAPDYLPPQGPPQAANPKNAPAYRAPDYLPPHREQQGQRPQYQQQQQQQPPHRQQPQTHHAGNGAQQQYQQRPQPGNAGHGGRFKGPDYLPPHKSGFMASPVRGVVREQHARPQSRPTAHAQVQQTAFRKPGYSQPYTEEHQHVEQHNVQGQQQQQSYQQSHHSQTQVQTVQTQTSFKGPDYLPPHNAGNTHQQQHVPQANFKGPDYLPPHQENPHQQQQQEPQTNFKGPDYLPPHQETTQQQQHFNSPQQQDTTAGSFAQQQGHQTNYKGPDYLPPHQDAQPQPHFNSVQQQQSVAPGSYQAPDYLPPQAEGSHHHGHNEQHFESEAPSTGSANEYRAPGYLPPGYDFPNPEEQQQDQPQQLQVQQYQEEEQISYPQQHPLPQPGPQHEIPQTAPIDTPHHAAEYLPPGYEFNRPEGAEEAIAQLHSLPQQVQPQAAPQYHQHQQAQVSQHHQQQHQQVVVQAQIQVAGREQASDIIYGSHGHHSTAEVPSSFQGDGYLPPHADPPAGPTSPVQPQANYQVQQGQVQTVATYNGGNSFSQQQIQQEYQQNTQQVAPQRFPEMPTSEGEPQYNAAPNNYPGPTAPSDFAQTEQQQSYMHSLSSYMTAVQPFERYGASQFTEPRRPFAQYGPPPTAAPHYQPQAQAQAQAQAQVAHQSFEVPSMYRGQTTRPQSYAPAMAYTSNAVTKAQTYTTYSAAAARHQQQSGGQYSTGLNVQAKQSLQKFMPKDIQQHIATAQVQTHAQVQVQVQPQSHAQVQVQPQVQAQIQVQAPQPPPAPIAHSVPQTGAPPTSGKIRTVQIVNTNTVKTLKVLETSDHAGVKTIKILGHSNESPMGEHRIVKVVSQSPHNANENHVQTVKIYNDQKDVSIPATPATVASHSNSNNGGYLPPRAHATAKRAARVARQSLQQHKRQHTVTGRGRYRY